MVRFIWNYLSLISFWLIILESMTIYDLQSIKTWLKPGTLRNEICSISTLKLHNVNMVYGTRGCHQCNAAVPYFVHNRVFLPYQEINFYAEIFSPCAWELIIVWDWGWTKKSKYEARFNICIFKMVCWFFLYWYIYEHHQQKHTHTHTQTHIWQYIYIYFCNIIFFLCNNIETEKYFSVIFRLICITSSFIIFSLYDWRNIWVVRLS